MVQAEPASPTNTAAFSPAALQSAYGLSPTPYAGAGQTIAIVDAFDDPNIVSELTVFDTYWNLPQCGSDCFTKVDQNGGSSYPTPASGSWSVEIAMDVEWAHALAPDAHIILVEAADAGLTNLLAAEQYAGAHAGYVSNSWGFPEFPAETTDTAIFTEPGVSYFAAVSDTTGKTQYPATAPNVVAVGGSDLTSSGPAAWTGGGGCSAFEHESPSEAELASLAGCSGNQSTPEVSADAVDIPTFDASTGWLNVGGTSFATVVWAASAADSGRLVTNSAIASGSIPLRHVEGGTPLQTGYGDLGAIRPSAREVVHMAAAEVIDTL
jgi:subtilase family serine protease